MTEEQKEIEWGRYFSCNYNEQEINPWYRKYYRWFKGPDKLLPIFL